MPPVQVSRWCFTINNYTDDDINRLNSLNVKYIVFGREVGASGTPHLQGFVVFNRTHLFNTAKRLIGDRAHIEVTQGTNEQASVYCKKDGDFVERGELQGTGRGKRTDWDSYRDYILELGRLPSEREIILHNPSLYARYSKKCWTIARAFLPQPDLVADATPRLNWQTRCAGLVSAAVPSPRSIHFFVDPEGASGKSFMCRWALSKFPEKVQILRIGKRDDLSYAIDDTKSVFMFDIPRTQMTFLQYSVLESLKDRMIFSPKYESSLKVLDHPVQVLVFSNESPDETQLTGDRYNIISI